MITQKVNILAIGAHPDDVELSCSGTLLAHIAQGNSVAIVDLTQGELGTRGDAVTRLREANAAAQVLGVSHRINLGFKDGFFKNDEEHQRQLISAIRYFQPDIILANAVYDRHPDHGRAAQLIRDAAFLAGLPKIETHWEGALQQAHRPQALYHYIQSLDAKADFVIDISAYMDKKMESILAYKSQFFDPEVKAQNTFISSPEFLEFVKSRASNFGVPVGVRYAEGFTSNRLLAVNNLYSLR